VREHACMCVCVCVCVYARACAHVPAGSCVSAGVMGMCDGHVHAAC